MRVVTRRRASSGVRAAVASLTALAVLAAGSEPTAAAADQPAREAVEAARGTRAAERGSLAPGWGSERVVPGALLVTTRDAGVSRRVRRDGPALLAAGGLRARRVSDVAAGVTLVEVEPGSEALAAEALLREPGVTSVEPDYRFRFASVPDDPRYPQQWAHAQTGILEAWAHSTGSGDLKVAILDSGVDGTHPDLSGNVVAQVSTVVAPPSGPGTGSPKNNVDCPDGTQGYGHGTAVAGVVGGVGHNGVGVVGAAWDVGLVDVRVAGGGNCDGPSMSAVIRGLDFVGQHHADAVAVNLSFGMPLPHCPATVQLAIDALRERGVTVVAASGNDYGYGRMMPAGCDGVIAVGATRGDRGLASYSSRQRYLALVAPGGELGEGVVTTVRGPDRYGSIAGTSFAAPYVAGVVALVQDLRRQQNRNYLSPRQIESLLEITARHPDGAGRHDAKFGWGVLHAGDALTHVAESRPIPSLRPHPLIRWAHGSGTGTEPIAQAITLSRALFDRREAQHVVLARSDDYADALAGSALAFGVGPILFTPPGGPLDARVRAEIERVLAPGGRVYVLGGELAVDVSVEDELANLGYDHVRLRGAVREDTAAAIAGEVVERVADLGHPVHRDVIVATRGNWPDAVAGGSLAALYGLPVLLTPVNSLHPATRRELVRLDPNRVYVVGGTAAVSSATATAIGQAAAVVPRRLAGPAREDTAIAVGREIVRRLGLQHRWPTLGIAVNLDRSDAYASTLAATAAAAMTGSVFVPVREAPQSGVRVPQAVRAFACGLPPQPGEPDAAGGVDVALPGGADLLPAAIGDQLQALYDRPFESC
jgi:subtilisin family serine protease